MGRRRKYRYPGVRPGKNPGAYRIEYYDWDNTRRTKVFHGSESDAARLRRSIIAKVDRIKNGLELPPARKKQPITFSELWKKFYNDNQIKVDSGSLEQSSLNRYKFSVNALFDYDLSLENKLIAEIDWKDFEGFKIHRQSSDYSPEGINTNLRNMRAIFNYAVRKGHLKENPLKDVTFIKTTKRDVRYLNENEMKNLQTVLNKIDLNDEYQKDAHDLVIFYLYTGARASEALFPNFTWDCLNKDTVRFPNTKMNVERTIPLTDSVKTVLNSRIDIQGGPFQFDIFKVYKRTASIFKKAGIKDVSTHTLRKTAGAYYYIATRDIFATSRFLGHSSVKVTESHYVGLIQSLQQEYSKQFDNTLTDVLNVHLS